MLTGDSEESLVRQGEGNQQRWHGDLDLEKALSIKQFQMRLGTVDKEFYKLNLLVTPIKIHIS